MVKRGNGMMCNRFFLNSRQVVRLFSAPSSVLLGSYGVQTVYLYAYSRRVECMHSSARLKHDRRSVMQQGRPSAERPTDSVLQGATCVASTCALHGWVYRRTASQRGRASDRCALFTWRVTRNTANSLRAYVLRMHCAWLSPVHRDPEAGNRTTITHNVALRCPCS